jgi:sugar phosphate isomerase/epimerase
MTQPRPLALQLYTLRDALGRDFEGTLRRVAAVGYAGVETAGFPDGVSPAQAKALLDDLGLAICAAHAPLPLGPDGQASLDRLAALDTDRLVCPWLPPEEYSTLEGVRRACDRFNAAAEVCARHGLRLGIHNHWFEFERVDGTLPVDVWLERLDPAIFFELDTYWAQVGGVDPLQALALLGERVELLHVKDGPADAIQSDMVAVGQGALDYTRIIPAAPGAAWLIVELDRCATDMMTAVEQSYDYLTKEALGHGRA